MKTGSMVQGDTIDVIVNQTGEPVRSNPCIITDIAKEGVYAVDFDDNPRFFNRKEFTWTKIDQ